MADRSGWRWRLLVSTMAVLGLLAVGSSVEAASSLPMLQVSEPGGISIRLGAIGSMAQAIVTVVNPSDADAHLSVHLAAEGTLPQAVGIAADPAIVGAHDAARVRLTFTLLEPTTGGPGSVVIGADGFAPAAVGVVIAVGASGPEGAVPVLGFAFAAAAAFLGLRLWVLRGKYDANGQLGSVRWDFSRSWATNITTIGAILGTVTAAGVLPRAGRLLVADEVAGLSVFFGILAVLSGFVYTVLSRPVLDQGEPARQGYVKPFLLAAGITLAAVIGELATLALLLADAAQRRSTTAVAIALLVLLGVAGFLVLRHAWDTLGWTLTNLVKPRTRGGPRDRGEPARSWSLL
jgi:hypothetical protein